MTFKMLSRAFFIITVALTAHATQPTADDLFDAVRRNNTANVVKILSSDAGSKLVNEVLSDHTPFGEAVTHKSWDAAVLILNHPEHDISYSVSTTEYYDLHPEYGSVIQTVMALGPVDLLAAMVEKAKTQTNMKYEIDLNRGFSVTSFFSTFDAAVTIGEPRRLKILLESGLINPHYSGADVFADTLTTRPGDIDSNVQYHLYDPWADIYHNRRAKVLGAIYACPRFNPKLLPPIYSDAVSFHQGQMKIVWPKDLPEITEVIVCT